MGALSQQCKEESQAIQFDVAIVEKKEKPRATFARGCQKLAS
jgi:hypothetical protein